MPKILILPDLVASKIAAGEVVERPASVAKELLENALDAGATRIDIEVQVGGKRLLRVADDGQGMSRDDALLALERHATSKIRTADDLEEISTLGFRGEALPSIASVSRLRLRTMPADAPSGTEVEVEGGKIRNVRDCAWSPGTEVMVRDLFYNIPARRKFLKSDSTELFHITNLVTHYALAYPRLGLQLVHNERILLAASPVEGLRERAYQLFGGEFLSGLLELVGPAGPIRVRGFVSKPSAARSTRESQYFFVNGRYVRDRVLSRALVASYRAILPSGLFPAAILFVELPPSDVDVNVHPAKTEVRFRSAAAVQAAVEAAIRDSMAEAKPMTELKAAPTRAPSNLRRGRMEVMPKHLPPSTAFRLQAPLSTPQRPPAQSPLGLRYGVPTWPGRQEFDASPAPESTPPIDAPTGPLGPATSAALVGGGRAVRRRDRCLWQMPASIAHSDSSNLPEVSERGARPLGQLRDSFIVAAGSEGLLLVDQHVAHERVLFEQLRSRTEHRAPTSQPLLIPEVLDLSPAQLATFDYIQEELVSLGIEAEVLSGRTMAIKALPSDVGPLDARSLILEILEIADEDRRSISMEALRDEIRASMACQAAIKINMPLTDEKMRWLLDSLFQTACPTNCPHGRPIVLHLTIGEIEKLFHR